MALLPGIGGRRETKRGRDRFLAPVGGTCASERAAPRFAGHSLCQGYLLVHDRGGHGAGAGYGRGDCYRALVGQDRLFPLIKAVGGHSLSFRGVTGDNIYVVNACVPDNIFIYSVDNLTINILSKTQNRSVKNLNTLKTNKIDQKSAPGGTFE